MAIDKNFVTLIDLFTERIGDPHGEEVEGLENLYTMLKSRGIDAYQWISEAIVATANKDEEKRTGAYIIGMVRNWLKFGLGNVPSNEERELILTFEKLAMDVLKSNMIISETARNILYNLMGDYGTVKTVVSIMEIVPTVKPDLLTPFAEALRSEMKKKYGVPEKKYSAPIKPATSTAK